MAVCHMPVLVALGHCAYAQPSIEWQRALGGANVEEAFDIEQTPDGGFIIAATAASSDGDVVGNQGGDDAWVVKLDGAGMIEWQRSLGGSGFEEAQSIDLTDDGGYIVAGWTSSVDGDVTDLNGGADLWLVRLDATGQLIWQKCLGGSGVDEATAVITTSDGGFVVVGKTLSNDGDVSGYHGGGGDFWVVKTNGQGDLLWQRTLGGSDYDVPASVLEDSAGDLIVVGRTHSDDGDVTVAHGDADLWVVRLSASGTLIAQRTLGGSSYDDARSIAASIDGGFTLAGTTLSDDGDVVGSHGSAGDLWVVRLDDAFDLLWQKVLGGTNSDFGGTVLPRSNNGWVILATTSSDDHDVTMTMGSFDYWLVELDATGDLQWQRTLGGQGSDWGLSVTATTDGGFACAGWIKSFDGDVTGFHGGRDAWIVKLHSGATGIEQPIIPGIRVRRDGHSDQLHVSTDRPLSSGSLEVYDGRGRLWQQWSVKGQHHTLWVGDLAPGTYFITIRTEIGVFAEKYMHD